MAATPAMLTRQILAGQQACSSSTLSTTLRTVWWLGTQCQTRKSHVGVDASDPARYPGHADAANPLRTAVILVVYPVNYSTYSGLAQCHTRKQYLLVRKYRRRWDSGYTHCQPGKLVSA